MRVLLIEDDEMILDSLKYSLEQAGYETISAGSVRETYELLKKRQAFNICLLDIRLPDGTGFEICDALRRESSVPILFLTACDDEVNAVRALENGADDYIAKPFRVRELLARMNAVLRRAGALRPPDASSAAAGRCQVNLQTGKVYCGGEEVVLTAMEYKLLLVFLRNRGRLLTRGQILNQLWDDAGSYVNDNTLTVYVKRLREKLGDNEQAQLIRTVRGIGYQMECAPPHGTGEK